jgi:hypothetical protein
LSIRQLPAFIKWGVTPSTHAVVSCWLLRTLLQGQRFILDWSASFTQDPDQTCSKFPVFIIQCLVKMLDLP